MIFKKIFQKFGQKHKGTVGTNFQFFDDRGQFSGSSLRYVPELLFIFFAGYYFARGPVGKIRILA